MSPGEAEAEGGGLSSLLEIAAEAIRPDPDLTLVEWAERHYHLDTASSPHAGQYRVAKTPYCAEPLNRLSPHDTETEQVVLMFGSQLGKTTIGLIFTGYSLAQSPSSLLVVMPTVDLAHDHSRTRIEPMIEASPQLRERVPPRRSRDGGNAVLRKQAPGAALMLAGANAPAGLSSKPIRRLILDEEDRYPLDSGGEGSPSALAIQRTAFFFNRKILRMSTPTRAGASRIAQAFEQTDQRRYFVPCPRCGAFQTLKWAGVHWEAGRELEAWYECEHCSGRIANHEKTWMLARGEWRATAVGLRGRAGYHLSSLYAPVGALSWGKLAEEFVNAKRLNDPTLLQAFVNTKLAETWDARDAKAIDRDALEARAVAESWAKVAPAGVVAITAGADVQADRIEVEAVGWGEQEESWSLDYTVLEGDTTAPEVWEALDRYLDRRWAHQSSTVDLPIALACIDANYRQDAVLRFVRRRRRAFAVIGRDGDRPIWPRASNERGRAKRGLRRGDVRVVGVDAAKERLFARLETTSGPGACYWPAGRPSSWFEGLASEYRAVRYVRGREVINWTPLRQGIRNEPLDCRVYAMAALHALYAQGLDLGAAGRALRRNLRPIALDVEQVRAPVIGPEAEHVRPSSPVVEHAPSPDEVLGRRPSSPAPSPAPAPSRRARRFAAARRH